MDGIGPRREVVEGVPQIDHRLPDQIASGAELGDAALGVPGVEPLDHLKLDIDRDQGVAQAVVHLPSQPGPLPQRRQLVRLGGGMAELLVGQSQLLNQPRQPLALLQEDERDREDGDPHQYLQANRQDASQLALADQAGKVEHERDDDEQAGGWNGPKAKRKDAHHLDRERDRQPQEVGRVEREQRGDQRCLDHAVDGDPPCWRQLRLAEATMKQEQERDKQRGQPNHGQAAEDLGSGALEAP